MAKPPSGYPGPEGYPCGKSWKKSLIVTGQLPGMQFGKNLTHTLPPVAIDLLTGKGKLGWDGQYEAARREQLLDRLEDVVEQIKIAATWLTPGEVASLEWLADHAAAELGAAADIHMQWRMRGKGTFPLALDDTLAAFPGAKDWRDCANPENKLSPPGPRYGFEVEAAGDLGTVTCPTRNEIKQRKKDRQQIAARFVDAAHFIRCAEYGIWRLSLYRQALDAWKKGLPASGPGSLSTPPTPPPTPPDGLTTTPPGPPPGPIDDYKAGHVPPSTPPDVKLPPPPSKPLPPQTLPTGPESATATTTHQTSRRRRGGSSFTTKAIIARVVVGGIVVAARA